MSLGQTSFKNHRTSLIPTPRSFGFFDFKDKLDKLLTVERGSYNPSLHNCNKTCPGSLVVPLGETHLTRTRPSSGLVFLPILLNQSLITKLLRRPRSMIKFCPCWLSQCNQVCRRLQEKLNLQEIKKQKMRCISLSNSVLGI